MKTEHLLHLASSLSSHSGLKQTTIGAYAANDGKFFGRLASGSSCTLRTATTVMQWFADNWPEDLQWPTDIPRPPRSKKEAA